MSIRKIKARINARRKVQVRLVTPKSANHSKTFIDALNVPPTPEQVKVIRRKDSELVGYFSREEADAVITKAKAQKKATLVVAE